MTLDSHTSTDAIGMSSKEQELLQGREVFAPVNEPFESPAKEFVPGPFYKNIEERVPELDERSDAELVGEEDLSPKGKKFSVDRRDFMRLFSASSIAASTACVRRPVEKAIPYVDQPTDHTPGTSIYYASTCGGCPSACGLMVKTREGRPAKVEGMPGHPMNDGSLCASGQASVQGLYHPERRKSPAVRYGKTLDNISWEDALTVMKRKLGGKSNVAILTKGSTGHSSEFYKEVLKKFGSSADNYYTYESNSLIESVVAAHDLAYGIKAMPRLDLGQANVIAGFGSDFLDGGTNLLYHTRGYAMSQPYRDGQMGMHIQFESTLTNTGGAADERHVLPPGTEYLGLMLLVKALHENSDAKGSGQTKARIKKILDAHESVLSGGYERIGVSRDIFDGLAKKLIAESGVVVAGGSHTFDENATLLQLAAIMANELVGAYEKVLQFKRGWMVAPVNPGDMARFMKDANDNKFEAVFVIDTNPMFTMPKASGFSEALAKVPFVVSIQSFPNETDLAANLVLPAHHYLESWGDEQPVTGFWTVRQPTVRPVTDSKQAEDILLWALATVDKPLKYTDYHQYLTKRWGSVQKLMDAKGDSELFFKRVLNRGFLGKVNSQTVPGMQDFSANMVWQDPGSGGLRFVAPLDTRLQDGRGAHLPVLQEAGDSLTTIAWDSWVAMSPERAKELGVQRNDLVRIEGTGGYFEAAVFPMPGLHKDVISVPRGNGHSADLGTIEGGNGVDPLVALGAGFDKITSAPVTAGQMIKVTKTGKKYRLAAMQKQNDIANRNDVVKVMSLKTAAENKTKTFDIDKAIADVDLYPKLKSDEFRWGLSIDLNKCSGCSACMVACSIENNIPQVGRKQVLMGREMHWIRLDRYFSGPVSNPQVTYQPVMCQHCNHAPCEAVCPVFATMHDSEGVNAMIYNRCVGTRYCANACPYKVRRFNWWTHKWGVMGRREQDRNPRALNPDVTVRTRGVMEKCNFCYQRIREAKHAAKLRGSRMRDGEIRSACQQTCPTQAITFGNLNDDNSRVSRQRKDYRSFLMLNADPSHKHFGIKTWPNVNYLAKVTHVEQGSSHN